MATLLQGPIRLSERFKTIVAIEIIVIFVGAAFLLPGGEDLHDFYRPFAAGCVECGFTPYFASWILFPLSLPPENLIWPLWTLVTSTLTVVICRHFGTNPVVALLSFPFMGVIWLGQIDLLIMLGLLLTMRTANPYARGLGVLLMAIKPQVAGPALLVLLWAERERIKVLMIPSAVFLFSLLWWGIDWPLRWFAHQPALHVWRLASLFPFGVLAFLSIPFARIGLQRVRATLLATALAVPSYGVYSYSIPLVTGAPWWSVPLSYAWVLAYPWLGADSLRFAWVLPLALLAHQLWTQRKAGGLVRVGTRVADAAR